MKGPFPGQLLVPLSCRAGGRERARVSCWSNGGSGLIRTVDGWCGREAGWSLRFITVLLFVKVHLPYQSEAPPVRQTHPGASLQTELLERQTIEVLMKQTRPSGRRLDSSVKGFKKQFWSL